MMNDKGMKGNRFVDVVLQMAHVSASAAATEAHAAYGRLSAEHLALQAVMSLAASMRDNNREAAETALARFFAETNH